MIKFYNKEGLEVDIFIWEKLMTDMEYRIVKQERTGNKAVSTVWLGLDHNWLGSVPLIFETMVFDKEGKPVDMERYTTEEQAKEGHDKLTLLWSNDDE